VTVYQRRLDGSEYLVRRVPPVPYRTDHEGYERWRHQYRDDDGEKCEDVVAVHRLAAVAWYGFDVLDGDSVVHHESGIPWDNRESNVSVMDRSEHSILHNTEGSA
jgi:hypothetical protein